LTELDCEKKLILLEKYGHYALNNRAETIAAEMEKFISRAKTPASKPKFTLAKAAGRTAYLIKKCFALFC